MAHGVQPRQWEREEQPDGRVPSSALPSARQVRETAHDLRAPLTAIAGYTQQLVESAGAALSEDAQDAVAGLWHGIVRMRSIIEFVLDGAPAPEDDVVDCDVLVLEILELHAPQLADAGASVHIGNLGLIKGDALQTFRVFQNLIANAICHADPEGALALHITAVSAGGYRAFTVADNGKGIPVRERRSLLSDRVGRQDDRRGLGFSICKRLVEHRGGRIWIDSAPGRGTAVTFTLPASGS